MCDLFLVNMVWLIRACPAYNTYYAFGVTMKYYINEYRQCLLYANYYYNRVFGKGIIYYNNSTF